MITLARPRPSGTRLDSSESRRAQVRADWSPTAGRDLVVADCQLSLKFSSTGFNVRRASTASRRRAERPVAISTATKCRREVTLGDMHQPGAPRSARNPSVVPAVVVPRLFAVGPVERDREVVLLCGSCLVRGDVGELRHAGQPRCFVPRRLAELETTFVGPPGRHGFVIATRLSLQGALEKGG